MSPTILARELDLLEATLADLGDYLRETENERHDLDRRTLGGFCGDALLHAVEARRLAPDHSRSC